MSAAPAPSNGLRIAAIVLILLAGIMTGAQLAKIAPIIPWYESEIGLSLITAGWLAATLGIFIALGAVPAGWLIDRLGGFRSIAIGIAVLGLGGTVLSLSTSPIAIFAARLIEAAGYLALCVALPAALNDISPLNWKGPVLAIWNGFVPLGFAVSDFLAGAMLPAYDAATYLLSINGLFVLLGIAALLLLPAFRLTASVAVSGSIRASLSPRALLVAVAFGAFVVLSISMFTWMPAFVAGEGSHYLLSAGVIALCVPLGNVLAGVLVRGKGAVELGRLSAVAFVICALTAIPAFSSGDPLLATASALVLALGGAVVASTHYAAVPFITPDGGSPAVLFGLIAQAGGIGTLIGPPLAAVVVGAYGWTGFGVYLALVAVIGLVCLLPLTGWFSALSQTPRQ
jgi:MFS family permease